jgi:N-acetylmuramoyl-L-alanine amidase
VIRQPDSPLVSAVHPTPNFEPRAGDVTPSILLLHYTGVATVERAIEILSRADCKVSAHYVIDEDGRITQMVAETARAWHAGVSVWGGERDINSHSIGIEIHNPGHSHGYPEFPPSQMEAVRALGHEILTRHAIRPERVLAHSDVAPTRKIDPGEKFDWPGLAKSGVGFLVEPVPSEPQDCGFGLGSEGPPVAQARKLLAEYGYGIGLGGVLDEDMQSVLRAFQLHFRPARCDGRLDRSTLGTLERLVAALRRAPVV